MGLGMTIKTYPVLDLCAYHAKCYLPWLSTMQVQTEYSNPHTKRYWVKTLSWYGKSEGLPKGWYAQQVYQDAEWGELGTWHYDYMAAHEWVNGYTREDVLTMLHHQH